MSRLRWVLYVVIVVLVLWRVASRKVPATPPPEPHSIQCWATYFDDYHGASRAYHPSKPCVAYWGEELEHDSVIVWSGDSTKCDTLPILDRGPGVRPIQRGVYIDFTPSAFQLFASLSMGRIRIRFRPLRAGHGWQLPYQIRRVKEL